MLIPALSEHESSILQHLALLKDANILRALDYQFARFIYHIHPSPLLALMGAWVSYETGQGNTCLDLKRLKQQNIFNLPTEQHCQLINAIDLPIEQWEDQLKTLPSVGNGTQPTPLVYCHHRLYLHRHWHYETIIIKWLQKQTYSVFDTVTSHTILNRLFPEKSDAINWQKVAAALAASTTFTVISGGPGTGKTTTVVRLMALLIELSTKKDPPLSIALAAPTGKAAARLSESIQKGCETLNCPSHIKRLIPKKAGTLHRLLGARPGKTTYRYNAQNPLHMDVLVVDEASMIDLTLMARLLLALPSHTKLILLGDRNQLASVEAGSVLGDICAFADQPYDIELTPHLQKMTDEHLPPAVNTASHHKVLTHKTTLNNHLCLLRKSFRFTDESGIGHLAKAINAGDSQTVKTLWEQPFDDITLHTDQKSYSTTLRSLVVKGYTPYLHAIAHQKNAEQIHALFNQFQLLCALRTGDTGVDGLNTTIYQALKHQGLLPSTEQLWYPGRPIMITRNDHTLELYNGDIGIALQDNDGKLRVAFTMPDGHIKMLLPNRLPEHDTVFAMTVHKSQGSEFNHTVFVLPEQPSPILTRELLYTGITRAKKKLDILGDPRLIERAIKQPTLRYSGIVDRLVVHSVDSL